MSERQAGYAPRDGEDKDGVLVKVEVQAPSEELEDLVELVVARLEGAGLISLKRTEPTSEKGKVQLTFKAADWLQ